MEIFYYDGTTVTQLTDDDVEEWAININNSGELVWYGDDGRDSEIFYYDGTTITQITDNDYDDFNSQINNNGEIV